MEVTVNGKRITLDDGSSVLDAINISGTPISQLCKDPDMNQSGHVGHVLYRSTA